MSREEDLGAEPGLLRAARAAVDRHRTWFLVTAGVVLVMTMLAYALLPWRYTARANVWLDNRFDALVAGRPIETRDAALSRNTEVRVLASADVAAQVVDALGLAKLRGVGQPRDGETVSIEQGRREAIAFVQNGLKARASGTSYAAVARFSAGDPELATGILNRTLDEYVDLRRTGGARGRERDRRRGEVAVARDAVLRADAALASYRAASDLIARRGQPAAGVDEVAGLSEELRRAEAGQREADAALRRAGVAREGDAATSTRLQDLRRQLDQAGGQTRAVDLVPVPDRRRPDLTRAIATETRRATSLLADAAAARDRVAVLRAARDRASAARQASSAAAEGVARLDQDAREARDRHAAADRAYRELLAAQRGDRGTAYVIARARVPAVPNFPNPLIFTAGGIVAALLAAGGVVLLLELLEKGFRTRRQVERNLGIPVIGMVPDLSRVPEAHVSAEDPMGPPDFLFTDSRSAFSGAFRGIHAGLRLGGSQHSPRSIAVCSALPDEGKTTVAICLARSAALAGLRVVLVDCDVRRPAASRALAGHVEHGIAELLAGKVELKDALLRDTPSGAWFLAHSSEGEIPPTLFGTPEMADLLAALARDFDLVILDTAPALALAEARAVAAMADGVLLVARWRKTPVEATGLALDMLRKAGANVTAAALTMVDA